MTAAGLGQRGQTLVVFALVLALFLAAMVALVGDLGKVFVTYSHVDGEALLAVQAGATAIDQQSLYGGVLRLDVTQARLRCEASLSRANLPGDCSRTGPGLVVAVVDMTVSLPVPLLGAAAPVHVQRTARPGYGGNSGTVTT
ncbi:MAG: hypothetical protein M3024_05280 [Candidatus Dormibacteraeota bacterium]|nr:hypothetical protein [Candidatus Dormibacteraeota bacterium]